MFNKLRTHNYCDSDLNELDIKIFSEKDKERKAFEREPVKIECNLSLIGIDEPSMFYNPYKKPVTFKAKGENGKSKVYSKDVVI